MSGSWYRTGLRLIWSCPLLSDSAISGVWHLFQFAKTAVLGSFVITPQKPHSVVPLIHMKTTRYINSLVACCGIHSAHRSLCSVWAMQPLHWSTCGWYGQDTVRTGKVYHWVLQPLANFTSAVTTSTTSYNGRFHTYSLLISWALQTHDSDCAFI